MPQKPVNNKVISQVPNRSEIVANKPANDKSKAHSAVRIPNRVVESKLTKPAPLQNGRQLKAPSKLAGPTKSTGIPNKFSIKPKQEVKAPKKSEDETNITFKCDISHIEPDEELSQLRTSFAPKDFVFDLGPELSFGYDPLELYKRLKAGEERTSTPKRKEIAEIQAAEKGKTEESSSETGEVSEHQVTRSTSAKTEDSSSETGQVSEDQVVSSRNTKQEDSCPENIQVPEAEASCQRNIRENIPKAETEACSQQNATESFENIGSNYVEAVTKLVSETSVSENDSDVQHSSEVKSRIHGSANFLGSKDSDNIVDGLKGLAKERLDASDVTKSSVEEKVGEFNIDPAVFKQETLENNANICSTTFEKTSNVSLENPLKCSGTKLNKEDIFEVTEVLPMVEQALVTSSEEKENIHEELFETIPKLNKSGTNISNNKALGDNTKTTIDSANLPEEEPDKLKVKDDVFEESGLSIAGPSSSSVSQFKVPALDGDKGIAARRRSVSRASNMSLRMGRRSEMPQLESISESIECSSPLKSPPKPPKTPKSRKSAISKDFTPRRSLRIARNSVLDATENLFDVRLSLCGDSPDFPSNYSTFDASKMTYDFDNLHLEQVPEAPPTPQRCSTRTKKVSLLYTPPQNGRASTVRQSVLKGDLMNFSPDIVD